MNKHGLIMVLCCLIPVIIVVILRVSGVQNIFLSYAGVLICPLSMGAMMIFMGKKKSDHEHGHRTEDEKL